MVPLGTEHVALSKRIFRLSQCAFSIVLNFWQRGGSYNRVQRTLSGRTRANPTPIGSNQTRLIRNLALNGPSFFSTGEIPSRSILLTV